MIPTSLLPRFGINQHEAANFAFQEVQLLNIVVEYLITAYNKLPCHTSFLGGEEDIQELITSAHPRYCQDVFASFFGGIMV